MARTPKNLDLRQLTATTLTTIYTAPAGINTTNLVLRFTNTTTSNHSIDIYHGDGTDYLIDTLTLPGGSGKSRTYYGLNGEVINATETIKIQSDSASAFNSSLSGSEVEV